MRNYRVSTLHASHKIVCNTRQVKIDIRNHVVLDMRISSSTKFNDEKCNSAKKDATRSIYTRTIMRLETINYRVLKAKLPQSRTTTCNSGQRRRHDNHVTRERSAKKCRCRGHWSKSVRDGDDDSPSDKIAWRGGKGHETLLLERVHSIRN